MNALIAFLKCVRPASRAVRSYPRSPLEDLLPVGVVARQCPLPTAFLDPLWLVVVVPAYLATVTVHHVAVGIIVVRVVSGLLDRMWTCARDTLTTTVGARRWVDVVTTRVAGHVSDGIIVKALRPVPRDLLQAVDVIVLEGRVHLVGGRGGGLDKPVRLVLCVAGLVFGVSSLPFLLTLVSSSHSRIGWYSKLSSVPLAKLAPSLATCAAIIGGRGEEGGSTTSESDTAEEEEEEKDAPSKQK